MNLSHMLCCLEQWTTGLAEKERHGGIGGWVCVCGGGGGGLGDDWDQLSSSNSSITISESIETETHGVPWI